jgi:hypothetical protein
MKTKKCIKCGVSKNRTKEYFNPRKTSKDGFRNECKDCMNLYKKSKIDLVKNRDRGKKYRENLKQNDPIKFELISERTRNTTKEYRKKGVYPNGETVKQVRKRNSRTRYEKIRKNPFSLMIMNIRSLVALHIKKKSMSTENILGCDWETFRQHIETKFVDGMNWNNHGREGWHYDHIIPISSARNEEELYRLNHYSNFQPLWWQDNIKKSNKILVERV